MKFPTTVVVARPVPGWPFVNKGQACTALRAERRGNREFLVVAQKKDEVLLEKKYFDPQVTYVPDKH